MSAPISRKLVEGRSGELFVVVGNPDVGYTLHHAQLSEVGHYKRSWQAVKRAQNGHDEVAAAEIAAPVPPREQLVEEGAGAPVPAPSSTPSKRVAMVVTSQLDALAQTYRCLDGGGLERVAIDTTASDVIEVGRASDRQVFG